LPTNAKRINGETRLIQDKLLSVSKRTRVTPFTQKVEAAGVKAYMVYNHMLLPTLFNSREEDYWHLCEHVQVWDVSCQRQVEIVGPDADRLVHDGGFPLPTAISNSLPKAWRLVLV